MSANMPESQPNLPSESETLLANASQASTAYQASTLNHPSAAGVASHRDASGPGSASGAAPYKKSAAGIVAVLLMAITFWLYAKPDVVIMLSEQLWSCF